MEVGRLVPQALETSLGGGQGDRGARTRPLPQARLHSLQEDRSGNVGSSPRQLPSLAPPPGGLPQTPDSSGMEVGRVHYFRVSLHLYAFLAPFHARAGGWLALV